MAASIKLKNFESNFKLPDVPVPGIATIVGASNIGKSEKIRAVATKPVIGYTHKITEAGVTWLALVGTNTKYDGHKVAYPDKGDVVAQIEREMRIINLARACQLFAVDTRPLACRYGNQVIGVCGGCEH